MSLQPAELSDSPAQLRKLLPDQVLQIRPSGTSTPVIAGLHEFPDLLKGEVQKARPSHELQPTEVFGTEKPVPSGGVAVFRAFGGREKTGGLVEADGPGVHTKALGCLADFETSVSHPIPHLFRLNTQERLMTLITQWFHNRELSFENIQPASRLLVGRTQALWLPGMERERGLPFLEDRYEQLEGLQPEDVFLGSSTILTS